MSSKTYIVPFDFSQPAIQALKAAGARAGSDGKVVLVHGMQVPIMGSINPAISYGELLESVRAHVEKRLEESLHSAGVKGDAVVKAEDIDFWLPNYAASVPNPVIVLARHGWGKNKTGFGGTAKRILRGAACPVWLVGDETGDFKKVTAAVDVDRGDERVAEAAAEICKKMNATLQLLFVRDLRLETGYLNEIGWPPAVAVFEDLRKDAEDKLKKFAAELSAKHGIKIDAKMIPGSPAQSLVQAATDNSSGVVVIGKHGRGKVETLLLGSTVNAVIKHWKRTLYVV